MASWIIGGLMAAGIAKWLSPGMSLFGIIGLFVMGVFGGFCGGLIAIQLGFGNIAEFDPRSFGGAIVGSLILLFLYRLLRSV